MNVPLMTLYAWREKMSAGIQWWPSKGFFKRNARHLLTAIE
jgi:hypothetical protein